MWWQKKTSCHCLISVQVGAHSITEPATIDYRYYERLVRKKGNIVSRNKSGERGVTSERILDENELTCLWSECHTFHMWAAVWVCVSWARANKYPRLVHFYSLIVCFRQATNILFALYLCKCQLQLWYSFARESFFVRPWVWVPRLFRFYFGGVAFVAKHCGTHCTKKNI